PAGQPETPDDLLLRPTWLDRCCASFETHPLGAPQDDGFMVMPAKTPVTLRSDEAQPGRVSKGATQDCSSGAHAWPPAIRLAAAARASAVTTLPDSMRAISSCRVSASSSSTRVTVARSACFFATRQWCAPRAATCGEWVTTST